jgi:hypothetical protein
VTGDEDDRQDRVLLVQLLLQLESGHARHADVEHEAAGPVLAVRIEELLRGAERLDRLADRAQQELQRIAHGCVVVDHEDGRTCVVGIQAHVLNSPISLVHDRPSRVVRYICFIVPAPPAT